MNDKTVQEFYRCHCYIAKIWGKESLPTNLVNYLLLDFRYSVFKILEKNTTEDIINEFKFNFRECYSKFDYELIKSLIKLSYPHAKYFQTNQTENFLNIIKL